MASYWKVLHASATVAAVERPGALREALPGRAARPLSCARWLPPMRRLYRLCSTRGGGLACEPKRRPVSPYQPQLYRYAEICA